jgi:hypothetical protein
VTQPGTTTRDRQSDVGAGLIQHEDFESLASTIV